MGESSQEIAPLDPNAVGWALNGTGPRLRRLELETTMRPGLVVVGCVRQEHPLQCRRPSTRIQSTHSVPTGGPTARRTHSRGEP
jgi:hypothetical protein